MYSTMLILAGMSATLGLGIAAFQAYYWLSYGVAAKISVLDAFYYVDERIITMDRLPGEAYGMLDAIPLAVLLVVLGILLLIAAKFVSQIKRS